MRMLLAFAVVLSVFPPRLSPLRAAVAYAPPSGARRGAPTRRSAPAALDGVDFWASRMGGSAGLQPEATANGPGGHGATPEAALTDALSTGPTNRRPAEERAQRESIALQDALVGVQQSREDGHAHGLQPRKKLRSERPASTMYAVAPRTWDAGLQSLNAQYASDANARQQSAFLAKLDKLISHLNATVHAAPRKKVARGGMYGPPKQQEQGLTKAAKREREKLVQQLVKQKGELQRLPQAEAKELMVSMQGLLSDPTVLSQVGLADPSAEARLRAKQEPATGSERYRFCIEAGSGWQWEARCKPRIDPLDPFAPTRKWLDVDEARAMLPDRGNEDRELGPVLPDGAHGRPHKVLDPGSLQGRDDEEESSSFPWSEEEVRSPWYCPHCQVSVNNDHAWLDHINGKAHHKKLGFSMRLKRHSDDEVLDMLQSQLERLRRLRLHREKLRQQRGDGYCSSDSDTWKLPDDDPDDPDIFPDFWDWDI